MAFGISAVLGSFVASVGAEEEARTRNFVSPAFAGFAFVEAYYPFHCSTSAERASACAKKLFKKRRSEIAGKAPEPRGANPLAPDAVD